MELWMADRPRTLPTEPQIWDYLKIVLKGSIRYGLPFYFRKSDATISLSRLVFNKILLRNRDDPKIQNTL
jgi:hypothetical protein